MIRQAIGISSPSDNDRPARPLVVAHRGASKAFPENTVEAFRAAREMGADMVELDVRRTLDGIMVVHHDPVIKGLGAIVKRLRSELPRQVPTLDDALDACDGMRVNIEIKNSTDEADFDEHHTLADEVAVLVAERGETARVIVSSFNLDTIDRSRAVAPEIATGFLFTRAPRRPLEGFVSRIASRGHVALHPHHRSVNPRLVTEAHHHGLSVNTWTVDDPDRMRELADMGVDAIITNVPSVALAALSDSHRR